jgi:AcrR family transcriptional regulator
LAKGEVLRDRTAAAIIDSAATILAARGEAASMEEIAAAAGIGRATLYRYFPTREELLSSMAAASVRDLAVRIEHANLGGVPVQEGIARLARAIMATGSKYTALSRDGTRHSDVQPGFDATVTAPIRNLFRRGVSDGALRDDIPVDVLVDLFSGLVRGALDARASGRRGIEESAAAVAALFLHGASAS